MSSPKFKVTLGIVPDYLFEGPGVKVDGVTAGKPAAKAGLKAGDVITKLGNAPTPDMQAYMQALGQFKKGDTTQVEVNRKDEVIQVGLEF
jgi:S1-C subfamily serine protease